MSVAEPGPSCASHAPGCTFEQFVRCPALMVGEFRCPGTPRITAVEAAPYPELILARQGAYVRRDAAGSVYIDRTVAAFFEAGRPYVIEHPRPRPDLTTVISLIDPAAVCEALRVRQPDGACFARSAVRASPGLMLLHRQLVASVRSLPHGALATEEIAVALVDCAVGLNHGVRAELAVPGGQSLTRREIDMVVAIAEYLNANYRSRIDLSMISAYTGYSIFHVCRLFQARMKTSIHRYLTTLRLESAMEALADSDAAVVSVALDHGFSSHSHFTAAFKGWTGVSPSEARQRARRIRA